MLSALTRARVFCLPLSSANASAGMSCLRFWTSWDLTWQRELAVSFGAAVGTCGLHLKWRRGTPQTPLSLSLGVLCSG